MVGKMMVSTFLANQAKEMSKVAIAVPSSFVMFVSGAHIKQQTSPGPVALSVFNRLGRFKLRIPELLTPASASIRYNIVYRYLLKNCLPLRARPGVAAVCFLQFVYANIDQAVSSHVVFKIEASYLVKSKHVHLLIHTLTRTSSKESCDEFMAEWFEVAIMLLKLFGNRGKSHPRLIMSHVFTDAFLHFLNLRLQQWPPRSSTKSSRKAFQPNRAPTELPQTSAWPRRKMCCVGLA